MDKITKGIITGLVIGLVLGAITGYFAHNAMDKSPIQGRESFQIDEKAKSEITSFFESTADINAINSYCEKNRAYCTYYCRNINPNHEICSQFQNISRAGIGGMPQKG